MVNCTHSLSDCVSDTGKHSNMLVLNHLHKFLESFASIHVGGKPDEPSLEQQRENIKHKKSE